MGKLKFLWVYSAANEETVTWHNRLIRARHDRGYDVVGFCCTPAYLNNRAWLPFPLLDKWWKTGYPPLMKMYMELLDALKDREVLIHYNGANLHPEFVKNLNLFKIYTAGDDPENTNILTKPVARYYDLHLVNNIACLDMYRSWGLENVFFWPLGSIAFPEDIPLTREDILDISKRDVEIAFVGEMNEYKKAAFESILRKFPMSSCWGRGWPNGYISSTDMKRLYLRAQIGFNIHNSIGPINFRLYDLPASGVMQICDNKSFLNNVFSLDDEVIGFETIDEFIEKIGIYLKDKKKQRNIALSGWMRWQRDYTPHAVWDKLVVYANQYYEQPKGNVFEDLLYRELEQKKQKYWYKRILYAFMQ